MVKQLARSIHGERGVKELRKALSRTEKLTLHKIDTTELISQVCHEVFRLVEQGTLLYVSEDQFRKLAEAAKSKGKKMQLPDVVNNDFPIYAQDAMLRNDWGSDNWKHHPPRGWLWREYPKGGKGLEGENPIAGFIYEVPSMPGIHKFFLHRDILEHPQGAVVFIEEMNKKLKKLIHWDKKTYGKEIEE